MISIQDRVIDDVFQEAVTRWPDQDFLVSLSTGERPMRSLTYAEVAQEVEKYVKALSRAGYGAGQRVAVLVGTCPEHYILKLAVNRLSMSFVPVNPDYRPAELAYLLEDSDAVLAISCAPYAELMLAGIESAKATPVFAAFETMLNTLPRASRSPQGDNEGSSGEASLLYTSGTTGKPKGCILSHEYELMVGASYPRLGSPVLLSENDRVFNPLPAFHINAGVVGFLGAMLVGAAHMQPKRFSAKTWWQDIEESGATIFHYLGVVISVLLADRAAGPEVLGDLRVGLGAGVEPALHVEFEKRFGIPLVEVWGMTEMCRVISMEDEPRMIETRAFGRAYDGCEVQVWDDQGQDVPRGTPGEMVLRHSEETPRKGFFSGYLNKIEATADAWEGGWFHTGDTVVMDEDGILFFVDRKKNIIRRAGENIAAAEIENVLFEDDRVVNVACVAVPDEVREEEVLAAIVLADGVMPSEETALNIFHQAYEKMAYYKPPGWVLFVDSLPVTGTQKVVKHQIFEPYEDPRERDGIFDFRALKKRG
ncbi:AMP-binding protein [Alisedimentitalea sp. MJ-SS2]|uniref:AMP-binding protein n=1 Tax=Aliisedimentitalea sp. MJ-SS2 TaxID=3049795 RepID=UPI00290D220D|nr:AMP-binding protein [Alisedimentitalea sp. MJ-SS2]MDU8926873.1 AMP-binding protein [Alisedimentitalea sp. MJ-SS2]